jgi:hypothetical protein
MRVYAVLQDLWVQQYTLSEEYRTINMHATNTI